ncbi:MAG TPA: transposase [Gallionellaceae bacterium]|nr:transposase [Gallionellaceae bacterium]
MARPIRLEYAGAIYHVTSRGEGGADVFRDDADRERFLDVLAEVVARFGWICHAYCLMNNHYHVLIETPEANLARGMRQLNGVYTQRFNHVHDSGGNLFQGRYKAILVERQNYLLELARHVVLNPLRLKVVRNLARYPWSSYPATAGEKQSPPWLHTQWILEQFGRTSKVAQRRYAEFVAAGAELPSPLRNVKAQILLGSTAFCRKMKAMLSGETSLSKLPRPPSLAKRPSIKTLFPARVRANKSLRNDAIRQAYQQYAYSMADIADAAQIHFSTVSKIIKKIEEAG